MSEKHGDLPRRQYFSVRTGKTAAKNRFDLGDFKRFFLSAYERLEEAGYFQEWFGYECVDQGFVPGKAGSDLDLFVFRKTHKKNLWPIRTCIQNYSEDDLFDIIELLFDYASAGDEGYFHSYSQCGMHYSTFKKAEGQLGFRQDVNEILGDYDDGYELSPVGEILVRAEDGLAPLLKAELPYSDRFNVGDRVEAAKLKYLRRGATGTDRRDAVRDLGDVLEFLRDEAKKVLKSKDESDLFTLANNFGIRHHNKNQKTNYDPAIWLSWMFYYYLATIHACVRLITKSK